MSILTATLPSYSIPRKESLSVSKLRYLYFFDDESIRNTEEWIKNAKQKINFRFGDIMEGDQLTYPILTIDEHSESAFSELLSSSISKFMIFRTSKYELSQKGTTKDSNQELIVIVNFSSCKICLFQIKKVIDDETPAPYASSSVI